MGCVYSTRKQKEDTTPKKGQSYVLLQPQAVASSPETNPFLAEIIEDSDNGEGLVVVVAKSTADDEQSFHDDIPSTTRENVRREMKEQLPSGPISFETAFKNAKSTFAWFKNTRAGIFLMERWLPLQDVTLDILITGGKEGWLFCSEDGLIWTKDTWWAGISCVIIAGTYIVWFVLSFFIIQRELQNFVLSRFPALNIKLVRFGTCTFWIIVGLPALAVSDVFFLLCFPVTRPRKGWMMNLLRLRKVTESLGESPGQSLLQFRMFLVKVTTNRMDLTGGKVATLTASLLTSLVNLGLTCLDIHTQAKAQKISFLQCFKDLLLVGLGNTAPLINNLKSMQDIDYSEEGGLIEEHQVQIAGVLQTCEDISSVKFVYDNAITHRGFEAIVAAMEHFPKAQLELPLTVKGSSEAKGNLIRSSQQLTIKGSSEEHQHSIAGLVRSSDDLVSVKFVDDNAMTPTAYKDVLDAVKNFPNAHLELPLPSSGTGKLTRGSKECLFHDGTIKELADMAELLQPRVLQIHRMPPGRERDEVLDLSTVKELTINDVGEEPLGSIFNANGLVPRMLSVRESAISAKVAEHMILHLTVNIPQEKIGFERMRVSGTIEFSHTHGSAPDNFSFWCRILKPICPMIYHTSAGQLVNLHAKQLVVQKPTAKDLSWILSSGASFVELVSPRLNQSAKQRCMVLVERIKTENEAFTFAIDLGSAFGWVKFNTPVNHIAVRLAKHTLKAKRPWIMRILWIANENHEIHEKWDIRNFGGTEEQTQKMYTTFPINCLAPIILVVFHVTQAQDGSGPNWLGLGPGAI